MIETFSFQHVQHVFDVSSALSHRHFYLLFSSIFFIRAFYATLAGDPHLSWVVGGWVSAPAFLSNGFPKVQAGGCLESLGRSPFGGGFMPGVEVGGYSGSLLQIYPRLVTPWGSEGAIPLANLSSRVPVAPGSLVLYGAPGVVLQALFWGAEVGRLESGLPQSGILCGCPGHPSYHCCLAFTGGS